MRKILFAALALLSVACTPQAYTMLVQKNVPGESGIDLEGKSVCIVYVQDGNKADSVFSGNFSDGLAQGIENMFFGGEKAVEVFSVRGEENAEYASKDTLVSMIMETGADVVMLVDVPKSVSYSESRDKYTADVYVYDSMNKADEVVSLKEAATVDKAELNLDSFSSDAQYLGFKTGNRFQISQIMEQYQILFYEGTDLRWQNAIDAAFAAKWDEAVTLWIELASDPKNSLKVSCAEYNIAVACHLTGNEELALEWLDRSDKDYPISLSSGLRKKIEAALQ